MDTRNMRRKPSGLGGNREKLKLIGIIAAAVVVLVGVLLFFLLQPEPEEPRQDSAEFSVEADGVVVRDETVYEAENYGQAEFICAEGERVAQNAEIAYVYKWGYNEDLSTQLIDIQQKILDYQLNNNFKDIVDEDLETLNQSIADKTEAIKLIIQGKEEGDIPVLERELKELMDTRRDYLKQNCKADAQLEDFYAQEEALISRINGYREIVKAPEEGMVSFYFDGCETLLNPQNIDKLTIQNIEDILNGKSYVKVEEAEAQRPLYRLVNYNQWYVMVTLPNLVEGLTVDEEYTLSFKDYTTANYTGKLIKMNPEQQGVIYTFEINEDIGELVSARRVDLKITSTISGIRIHNSKIQERDGETYVRIQTEEGEMLTPIKVLMQEGDYSIVRDTSTNDALSDLSRIV